MEASFKQAKILVTKYQLLNEKSFGLYFHQFFHQLLEPLPQKECGELSVASRRHCPEVCAPK